eukprot:TRINITY_DN3294_c0_g1_i5.p1 TRINITY_DN3294_c0_g1~~TRINITY_DN3294_c0_g1_i5.p1  ORF type:complete len:299 (+),score=92.48 TRINITY_DN3294_c0_g1_i5:53-949(+)
MLENLIIVFFFLMIRRPPRSTQSRSSAASDVYKRQEVEIGDVPFLAMCCSIFPCAHLNAYYCLGPKEEAAITHCGVLTSMQSEPGCHHATPCGMEVMKISTKQRVLDLPNQKVADGNGNPIMVSAVLNYRVADAKKALLNVTNADAFVSTVPLLQPTGQSMLTCVAQNAQATLKQTVGKFSYDMLKHSSDDINENMRQHLAPLLVCAGIEVASIRLNDLSYAPEVAAAMLKTQQARALIQARELIVEGAVRIAQDAVAGLERDGRIKLDDNSKARIVSNLLTVTCGESNAVPTLQLDS